MCNRRRVYALVAATSFFGFAQVSRAIVTWDGASASSDFLNDPQNWIGGVNPAFNVNSTNDDVVFTGTTRLSPVSRDFNVSDAVFRNVTFDANAGAFTFMDDGSHNSDFVFNNPSGGATSVNNSTNTQTIDTAFLGLRRGTLTAASGDFVFNVEFTPGNGATKQAGIVLNGAHDFYLNKGIIGKSAFTKSGAGTIFLAESTPNAGNTTATTRWDRVLAISGGNVQISNNFSLGDVGNAADGYTEPSANTTGALVLTNNLTNVGEFIWLGARSAFDAQIKNKSGDNTLSGIIQADAGGGSHDYAIESDGTGATDILRISGTIQTPNSTDLSAGLGGASTLALQGVGNGVVSGTIIEQNSNVWNITKKDGGTWTLGGNNGYTGTTTVEAGTLALGAAGNIATSSSISVKSGASFDVTAVSGGYSLGGTQTLKGAGTVFGSINAGSGTAIAPGDTAAGVLTLSGASSNLTLNASTVQVDLSNNPASGNDQLVIGGNLSLSGTSTIAVNELNGNLGSGTYTLMTYNGTLTGNQTNLSLTGAVGPRQQFTLQTSVPHQVNLVVTGSAGNLTWVGGANANAWDVNTTVNWTGATDNHFFNGDLVTFSSTGSTSPNVNVGAGSVLPGQVNFTNAAGHDYTISGAGDINVLSDLITSGSGNVTIANAGFSVGGNMTLGGSGSVTIANSNLAAVTGNVTTSGSENLSFTNAGNVSVGSSALIGGSGSVSFSNAGSASVAHDVTTSGSTNLTLASAGGMTVGGNFTSGSSGPLNVTTDLNVTGAFNVTGAGNVMIGGSSNFTVSGGFSHNGTGTVTLANSGTFNLGSSLAINSGVFALNRSDDITFLNSLSGAGTFRKQGTDFVLMTGNNTNFSGPMIVEGGELQLGPASTNALGTAAGGTTVNNGATLDLDGRNNAGEIITIQGSGVSGQPGALVDTSGKGSANGVRSRINGIILVGDATIGTTANTFPYLDTEPGQVAPTFQGNEHNLTVLGPGEWDLYDCGETHLANITLDGGATYFGAVAGPATTLGDQPGIVTIQNNGRLGLDMSAPVTKPITIASGNGGIECYSDSTVNSQVTMNSDNEMDIFSVAAFTGAVLQPTLTINGKLTGTGNITMHVTPRPGTEAQMATRTGRIFLTGSNDYTGATIVGGGGGIGNFAAAEDRITLELAPAAQSPILTGPGGADIRSGRLIFDYTASSPIATINALLTTSFANNMFVNGNQLRSSTAGSGLGLGDYDNGSSKVTVGLTAYGDANLDGIINALDFNALATNYGGSGRYWYQGDFNYDGTVNSTDFDFISNGFGQTLPVASAPTPNGAEFLGTFVPEPSCVALLLAGCLGLRRRKPQKDVQGPTTLI